MKRLLPLLLLCACERLAEVPTTAKDDKAAGVIARTAADRPPRERQLACVELGRVGGDAARDRLLELLKETTGKAESDGPLRLYAAVGLTLLGDPGTAIDLLNALSTINPNDYIGAMGAEENYGEYYTVDAQLCDALLGLGMLGAEEELVEQLRRRHRIRVLIDAYAVLRRRTNKDLPYRYNGSYEDRNRAADGWQDWLRATRAKREAERPFDAENARFAGRCRDMVHDLGTVSVNNQLIAKKVLKRAGVHAIPFLAEALRGDNRVAQRHAAAVLGDIGRTEAAPVLREALSLDDRDARAQAIEALRKIRDSKPRETIAKLLTDKDPEVRASAAHYLGDLGGRAFVAPLRAAVKGERFEATTTALLCALVRLGENEFDARLLKVFVEGEQLDRQAAREALEQAAGGSLGATALDPKEKRAAAAKRWQRN